MVTLVTFGCSSTTGCLASIRLSNVIPNATASTARPIAAGIDR